jgi:ActR/RegA family two-component response regulator
MATEQHVLLVDDEESIRLTMSMMLEANGFRVRSAASVAEALRFMREQKFHVLISDMNIERAGDGFTIVNAMRSTQPDAVRLILTGYPAIETALQALREGVDDYLIKPTDVDEIVQKMRSKLGEKRPLAESQQKRLFEVLMTDQQNILGTWLDFVKKDPDLGKMRLTDAQRVDHLPRLLAAIVSVLKGKELRVNDKAAAWQHGVTRHQQKYAAAWLPREARLLQESISACIHKRLLEIQISTLLPDMGRVFGIIQVLLEESINAFLHKQKNN